MPFYYDVTRETTTNGTTQTLTTHFRSTVAAAVPMGIVGLYANARHGTAGGGVIYGIRPGTTGSGGTASTENKKHLDNPTAGTAWLDDATAITAGATPAVQCTVGIAQTGGPGRLGRARARHGAAGQGQRGRVRGRLEGRGHLGADQLHGGLVRNHVSGDAVSGRWHSVTRRAPGSLGASEADGVCLHEPGI